MRKVTSAGQLVNAVKHLMSIQPEDGAIRLMFESALEAEDWPDVYWLVHNSDMYKVSGRMKADMCGDL